MQLPDLKEYARLRDQELTNTDIAKMWGTTAAALNKRKYNQRYLDLHPAPTEKSRPLRHVRMYLNKGSDYYKNERAPRKALMNKANKLRVILHERYGDITLYKDDDPDWITLREINKQIKMEH